MTKHETKLITNDESEDLVVVHNDILSGIIDIEAVEKKYNAKYVGEFTVRTGIQEEGGEPKPWYNSPVMIFYAAEKHPVGSNYMGMYQRMVGVDENNDPILKFYVIDGITAVEDVEGNPVSYTGVAKNGKVLYSAYRHDYQSLGSGHFCDGGRDYVRAALGDKKVNFKIVKDTLVEIMET